MKISEIILESENKYDQSRHIIAILGSANISIKNVSDDIEKVFSQYQNKERTPQDAIRLLEKIEEDIQLLMNNEEYWGNIKRNLESEFYTLGEEWLELENRVQKYLNRIRSNNR